MAERDRIIKLNVGGALYTTSKSVMTSVRGGFLDRVAVGEINSMRDHRGTIFIDRDGHVFRYVLNYLRTCKLTVPQGYKELYLLREEADFYGLPGLITEIDNILRSRKRRNKPRLSKQKSKSMDLICDENGTVIFEDDSSDFFYD
ncbi:BTB/POZ domain-containing protein KCTD21-like [Argopecten irradians]|uniref:BTB/POZ domain-containing protein KCTD21-like n=1 Tax=Argopecten irradians TaxID=31199 RepID=UPI0037223A3C